MIQWQPKKVKVSQLKEYEGNPRDFTERGMKELKRSIEKFGIAEPICCNPDLTIIGGHARKKTLIDLGIKEITAWIPERKLNDKEVKELNVRLNKNIAGDWNFDILANNFEIPDLLDWGFNKTDFGISDDKSPELKNVFEIVIECQNENEQEKFYNELSEKYKCRLLIL